MKFMSIRELRNYSGRIRKALARENVALTSNGKPFALMIGIAEDDDPGELERLVRQARAQAAVSRIRARARESGIDRLTAAEVEAEVQEARRERQTR